MRNWVKKVMIEAWVDYTKTFPNAIGSCRDPTEADRHFAEGAEWTNEKTHKKFVFVFRWEEVK